MAQKLYVANILVMIKDNMSVFACDKGMVWQLTRLEIGFYMFIWRPCVLTLTPQYCDTQNQIFPDHFSKIQIKKRKVNEYLEDQLFFPNQSQHFVQQCCWQSRRGHQQWPHHSFDFAGRRRAHQVQLYTVCLLHLGIPQKVLPISVVGFNIYLMQ